MVEEQTENNCENIDNYINLNYDQPGPTSTSPLFAMSIYDNTSSITSTASPTLHGILPRHSPIMEVTSNLSFDQACTTAQDDDVIISHKKVD